jgi:pyruvate/2-oxoglutarate/acetoin dehydrogenase E1 component
MAELLYSEALNQAIFEEMQQNPMVFIMGEGIAERGGIYQVTA